MRRTLAWLVATAVLVGALIAAISASAAEAAVERICPPQHGFFSKQVLFWGIPIKAHQDVADAALWEAHRRIARMLEPLPVAAKNLGDIGAEMHIIGKDQQTSDLPAHRHLKGRPFESHGKRFESVDVRARGLGGLPASCGEENLLKLPSDRFRDHRDICTHEFAHTLLLYGLSANVRDRVAEQYRKSTGKGLWKTAYASTNFDEYFAELSMWYFDSRGDYGRIEPPPRPGREWLAQYDPEGCQLLDSIYSGKVKVERIAWTLLAPVPLEREAKLRSLSSDWPTVVLFDNRSAKDCELFWLDFQGKRKPYGPVRTGQKLGQSTFATHPWVVATPEGKALGLFVPGECPAKVVIEPSRQDDLAD